MRDAERVELAIDSADLLRDQLREEYTGIKLKIAMTACRFLTVQEELMIDIAYEAGRVSILQERLSEKDTD